MTGRVLLRLVVATLTACLSFGLIGATAAAESKPLAHLHVSLGTQHVNAIATDGSLLYSFPMSSGSYGRTPPGEFRVYSRSRWTTATSDPEVTMPWMTRFNGGIGFHGIPLKNGVPIYTPLGIRPVSHGCVRMADDHARWIYNTIPNGTKVIVK